jgi:predicted transcriptional regulator
MRIAMATSVKLDADLKDRLARLADTRRRSAHWMMREAIRQYVEREEARESFRQEALRSWQEYRETGLHSTLDDTAAWLESWGSEDESESPAWRK